MIIHSFSPCQLSPKTYTVFIIMEYSTSFIHSLSDISMRCIYIYILILLVNIATNNDFIIITMTRKKQCTFSTKKTDICPIYYIQKCLINPMLKYIYYCWLHSINRLKHLNFIYYIHNLLSVWLHAKFYYPRNLIKKIS